MDWLNYLLPVFTLLLGIFIKELIEQRAHRRTLESVGKRWFAELRSMQKPIEIQIETLEKFLEEQDHDEFRPSVLQIYSALDGEIFKTLDKHALIKYLEFSNEKKEFEKVVKTANGIFEFIVVLSQLHQNLKERFQDFQQKRAVHIKSMDDHLTSFQKELRRYYDDLKSESKSDPWDDKGFRSLFDLYENQVIPYKKQGGFNPVELKQKFFQPLSKNIMDLQLDPYIMGLESAVFSGFKALKEIENEKHSLYKDIQTLIKNYTEQLEKLKGIINQID